MPAPFAEHICPLRANHNVARITNWPCGLMDKALVFGTKDCRFESCQGHFTVVVGICWSMHVEYYR